MRYLFSLWIFLFSLLPALAQDGFDLPGELYILSNQGQLERYGLGLSGIQTVSPETDYVLDFGIAPDGNWLAFRTETNLYVLQMDSDQPAEILLENADVPPIRGKGETIAWNPSADAIALTSLSGIRVIFRDGQQMDIATNAIEHLQWSPDGAYLLAGAQDNIWWIYRRDGQSLVLASAIPGAYGVIWTSGNQLLFAPVDGGLKMMTIAEGNPQSEWLDASSIYKLPTQKQDGKIRVFRMEDDLGRLIEFNQLGGQVLSESENTLDLSGTRWDPSGQVLIAFQGGALAILNPLSGQGIPLPVANSVSYGWGPLYAEGVNGFVMPANAYFRALAPDGVMQVWQMGRNATQPTTILPKVADVDEFTISLDARSIVYGSDDALWYYPTNGSIAPLALRNAVGSDAMLPVLNNDATQLAYVLEGAVWLHAMVSGDAQTEADYQIIYEIPESTTIKHLAFANGINALMILTGAPDQVLVIDLDSLGQLTFDGYSEAYWLDGSRFVAREVSNGPTTALHMIDINDLTADPIILLPLDQSWLLHSVQMLNPDTLRLAIQRFQPGSVQILDVAMASGDAQFVADIAYMTDAHLSTDARFIVGYQRGNGALLGSSIENPALLRLISPAYVNDFHWTLP
ncbi:hypothetical protein MASR2M15_24860 [Anaerolineales bacterium]